MSPSGPGYGAHSAAQQHEFRPRLGQGPPAGGRPARPAGVRAFGVPEGAQGLGTGQAAEINRAIRPKRAGRVRRLPFLILGDC